MTIQDYNLEDFNYRLFSEPFQLSDLIALNEKQISDEDVQLGMNRPLLEDFSKVDLSRLTAEDVRGYVNTLRNSEKIPTNVSNNYLACVVSDIGSFAMLRMFGVYSEIAGVRHERKFEICESLHDAAEWLLSAQGNPSNSVDSVVREIRQFNRATVH